MSVKIGINGFGRIGRLVFRASLTNSEVDVVAINDLTDSNTMAHLLTYDSVHGKLNRDIIAKDDSIEVDGKSITITSIKEPAKLPWGEMGVDIVAECTGLFRDRENASKHLSAGARKVIISAPASDPDITIVMGVNSNQYNPKQHNILSNASCTTNCLAPVAKILLENFGIKCGLMTTIHAYTGDQRLLDFPHKDLRRARAAALSMIPTTTGAAIAVTKVIPELQGKIDGLAIRIPTPVVSVVDFVAKVKKETSVEEVNAILKEAATQKELVGILGVEEAKLVSIDFRGNPLSSIVDASSTMVQNGHLIKIIAWYDNEFGYSNRLADFTKFIGEKL